MNDDETINTGSGPVSPENPQWTDLSGEIHSGNAPELTLKEVKEVFPSKDSRDEVKFRSPIKIPSVLARTAAVGLTVAAMGGVMNEAHAQSNAEPLPTPTTIPNTENTSGITIDLATVEQIPGLKDSGLDMDLLRGGFQYLETTAPFPLPDKTFSPENIKLASHGLFDDKEYAVFISTNKVGPNEAGSALLFTETADGGLSFLLLGPQDTARIASENGINIDATKAVFAGTSDPRWLAIGESGEGGTITPGGLYGWVDVLKNHTGDGPVADDEVAKGLVAFANPEGIQPTAEAPVIGSDANGNISTIELNGVKYDVTFGSPDQVVGKATAEAPAIDKSYLNLTQPEMAEIATNAIRMKMDSGDFVPLSRVDVRREPTWPITYISTYGVVIAAPYLETMQFPDATGAMVDKQVYKIPYMVQDGQGNYIVIELTTPPTDDFIGVQDLPDGMMPSISVQNFKNKNISDIIPGLRVGVQDKIDLFALSPDQVQKAASEGAKELQDEITANGESIYSQHGRNNLSYFTTEAGDAFNYWSQIKAGNEDPSKPVMFYIAIANINDRAGQ